MSIKYYLGIDVETTGQFLSKNAMIGIGCAIFSGESSEPIATFERYLKVPEGRDWELRCKTEFWDKIPERLEEPKVVMRDFVVWLDQYGDKYGNELIILSDTAGFDYSWIDLYLSLYTDRANIYYNGSSYRRIWDTNSAYHDALLMNTGKYEEWNLEKKLDCQNEIYSNDHNPLTDAKNIALNYIKFIEACKKRHNIEPKVYERRTKIE